jgi:hypothetical protein
MTRKYQECYTCVNRFESTGGCAREPLCTQERNAKQANESRRKYYISSSWKNRKEVRDLALSLRELGHEVYDFTDPRCRKTPEIPPEKFPEEYDPDQHSYKDYINSQSEWRIGVEENKEAVNYPA